MADDKKRSQLFDVAMIVFLAVVFAVLYLGFFWLLSYFYQILVRY